MFLKAEILCHYHIGETANSVHRCTLIPGGSELLVYTTLSGGIGMLVPFTSREVSEDDVGMQSVLYTGISPLYTRTLISSNTWRCTCVLSGLIWLGVTISPSVLTTFLSRLALCACVLKKPEMLW